MGLFDNIFLDKDTPTALLDNPEIKSPDGKKEVVEAPYDPKNDPIAPAIEISSETSPEKPGASESSTTFDIGGDLDFTSIGTDAPVGESSITPADITSPDITSVDVPSGTTNENNGDISSIAMIQGGTASVIDGIDLSGAPEKNEGGGELHIEIHSIEDHPEESLTPLEASTGGIYGLMGGENDVSTTITGETSVKSTGDTSEVATENTLSGSPIADPMTELIPESISINTGDTAPISENILEAKEDIFSSLNSITDETSHGKGGKIQDFIEKLIIELRTLNEEETRAEQQRQERLRDIEVRRAELEKEYETRKNALEYELSSLKNPVASKKAEKDHVIALINSFKQDLEEAEV